MDTALPAAQIARLVTLPEGNDHPVVDLPFHALIDGRQLPGRGLSLVAAYVAGQVDLASLGTNRLVRLVFDLDGFQITLLVEASVHAAEDGKGAALIFTQPTGPHLPQLRHLLNAFIAGDLVSLGQAIGVAGTAAPKLPAGFSAAAPPGWDHRFRLGAVALAAVAMVGLAGLLIYQRAFVRLLPDLGTVSLAGETLRATAAGQIVFLDTGAGKGAVVLAIQASNGEVLSLTNPCDCRAILLGVQSGSTVLMGDAVVQLAAPGDAVVVLASLDAATIFALGRGDGIDLTLPDGATRSAILSPGISATQPQRLLADPPLDETRIGQPVQIRILHQTGWFGRILATLRGRAAPEKGV